jgi:uncharacterized oligopeptide transporter (OPT) family protein
MHRVLVITGAIAGVVIAVAERFAPRAVVRWLPSSAGLGLGLILPLSLSLGMAIGAAIAAVAAARRSDAAERYVWPISAGVLAGESLAGVVVAIGNNFLG